MTVLSVGAGGIFKTLLAAVAASKNGDVIDVRAGTYVNDFVTINTKITIEGVGGLAHFVATVPPPNGKAIITTNTDVTLKDLELSGAKVADANGAGIRYQGGNLTIEDSYVHDNQDGILAASDPSGRITIDHSEFSYNGSNGYAHNIYINDVGHVLLENSYIHDSVGGGVEFRSRGANTTIINNRIEDGASAANYTIDVPDGGNVIIKGNVIQKTINAENPAIIHYGGGTVVPFHPASTLTVSNNVIVSNYDPAQVIGVINQSNLNGYTVVANVSGNQVFGLPLSQLTSGLAKASGNTVLATAPTLDKSHPWSVSSSGGSSGGSGGSSSSVPGSSVPSSSSSVPTTPASDDTLVLHLSAANTAVAQAIVATDDGAVMTPSSITANNTSSGVAAIDITYIGQIAAGSQALKVDLAADGLTPTTTTNLVGIDFNGVGLPSASAILHPGQAATFAIGALTSHLS